MLKVWMASLVHSVEFAKRMEPSMVSPSPCSLWNWDSRSASWALRRLSRLLRRGKYTVGTRMAAASSTSRDTVTAMSLVVRVASGFSSTWGTVKLAAISASRSSCSWEMGSPWRNTSKLTA